MSIITNGKGLSWRVSQFARIRFRRNDDWAVLPARPGSRSHDPEELVEGEAEGRRGCAVRELQVADAEPSSRAEDFAVPERSTRTIQVRGREIGAYRTLLQIVSQVGTTPLLRSWLEFKRTTTLVHRDWSAALFGGALSELRF
jgi:hypothetical protein